MHSLPECDEFIEVLRRRPQDRANVTAFGVGRTQAVGPVGEGNVAVYTEIDDDFSLPRKTVHVPRLVVLRIGDEQDLAKAARSHTNSLTQAA